MNVEYSIKLSSRNIGLYMGQQCTLTIRGKRSSCGRYTVQIHYYENDMYKRLCVMTAPVRWLHWHYPLIYHYNSRYDHPPRATTSRDFTDVTSWLPTDNWVFPIQLAIDLLHSLLICSRKSSNKNTILDYFWEAAGVAHLLFVEFPRDGRRFRWLDLSSAFISREKCRLKRFLARADESRVPAWWYLCMKWFQHGLWSVHGDGGIYNFIYKARMYSERFGFGLCDAAWRNDTEGNDYKYWVPEYICAL